MSMRRSRGSDARALASLAILTGMTTALIALALYHFHGEDQEPTVALAGPQISLAEFRREAQHLTAHYAWKEQRTQQLPGAAPGAGPAPSSPLLGKEKNLPCTNYSEGLKGLEDLTFGCKAHTAITGFKFQNCTDPNRTDIKGSYACLGLGDKIIDTATPSFSTACAAANSIDSWAAHAVQCPEGHVLRSWKIAGCGKDKAKTNFWCSKAVMGTVKEELGECFATEGLSLDFLDGKGGGCQSTLNGVMTGFQLQSDGCDEGEMRWKLSCTRIGMPGECRDGSHCDLYNIVPYGDPTPFHASGYWQPNPTYPDPSFYKEFYEQD